MTQINLNDEQWENGPGTEDYQPQRWLPREGRKVFGICGFDRGETAGGRPKITSECLIMVDHVDPDDSLNPPSDEGLTARFTMWMPADPSDVSEKEGRGLRFGIVALARAMRWDPKKGFDYTDDDDVAAICGNGFFEAEVKYDRWTDRDGNSRVTPEVDSRTLRPYTGKVPADWLDKRREAGERYVQRQEEREREQSAGGSSSGGRGSGGTSDGGTAW